MKYLHCSQMHIKILAISYTNNVCAFKDTQKWMKDCTQSGSAPPPQPRSFHAACTVGSKVIIMGGRGCDDQHFDDIHAFDTSNVVSIKLYTKCSCHALKLFKFFYSSSLSCTFLNIINWEMYIQCNLVCSVNGPQDLSAKN